MTSVNVTTTKNTVTVSEGDTRIVTIKTQGPQGPAFADGDIGDIVISGGGTVATIDNGAVNNAKIASDAAIALTKLATGALPTAITVTSANISDLSIVNADINASAAIAGTKVSPDFGSQNIVTTGTLGSGNITISNNAPSLFFTEGDANPDYQLLVNGGQFRVYDVTNTTNRLVVNTDGHVDVTGNLDVGAGLDVTGNITVTGTVDGRDVAADGTKLDGIETGATADQTASEIVALIADQTIAPSTIDMEDNERIKLGTGDDFQIYYDGNNANIINNAGYISVQATNAFWLKTTGLNIIDNDNTSNYHLKTIKNGSVQLFYDAVKKLETTSTGITVTGNIAVTGTVDGRDVAADGTKLDGVETGATADQTAAEIKTLLDSNGIVNSNVDASAAIAGSKINPSFVNNIVITNTAPKIIFTDSNANSDFFIKVDGGIFGIYDDTQSDTLRFRIGTSGAATFYGNLNAEAGLDVIGNITVSGTVDGVDIAARNTLFGGLTSSSGVLTNGVTATTQSASDNSTKVATTAYTDTAVANLVDSAPGTLNTLNELAAALGDDPNFATTITNSIATKMPLAGGTFTGNVTYGDDVKAIFGTGNDLQIFHDGSNSIINDNGTGSLQLQQSGSTKLFLQSNAVHINGNIVVSGTVDGRDVAADGTKLDGIESGATADQTASEIISLLSDQDITTTGQLSAKDLILSDTTPVINLNDSTANPDYQINNTNGVFNIRDTTNSVDRLVVNTDGHIDIAGNVDFGAGIDVTGDSTFAGNLTVSGTVPHIDLNDTDHESDYRIRNVNGTFQILDIDQAGGTVFFQRETNTDVTVTGNFNVTNGVDVTGNITVTGTVDGRDIATDGTKLDGIESNATADQTASEIVALVADQTIAPSTIDMEDNEKIKLGTGDDLEIYHSGSNSIIYEGGTGTLKLATAGGSVDIVKGADSSETMAKFLINGAVELYHDNSKKLETSSDGVIFTGAARFVGNETGFLAGKAQPTIYRTASTSGSYPFNAFGHLVIQSRNDGSNRDIIFATGTNSAKLNRITSDGHLDIFGDNQKLRLGASQDLQIYHDGNDSIIANSTGNLVLRNTSGDAGVIGLQPKSGENAIICRDDNNVELYFDNSKKFETTANGVKLPDSTRVDFGDNSDLKIYHHGDNSYIDTDTGDLILRSDADDVKILAEDGIVLRDNDDSTNFINCINGGAVELYHNGSKKFETTSTGATVTGTISAGGAILSGNQSIASDSAKLFFGASNDLEIYHDGSNSYLDNTGTGDFYIRGNNVNSIILRPKQDENSIIANSNGDVELYYNNSKKFETTSIGVNVESVLLVYGAAGNPGRLRLQEGGALSEIRGVRNSDSNSLLYFDTEISGSTSTRLIIDENGHLKPSTDSTYDLGTNSVRWRNFYADTLYGDGSNLTNITATADLVTDTSPQLGGALDTNGNNITFADNVRIVMGDAGINDSHIRWDTSVLHLGATGSGIRMSCAGLQVNNYAGTEKFLRAIDNGAVELYYDGSKKLETTSTGAAVETSNSSTTESNADTLIVRNTNNGASTYAGIRLEASSVSTTDFYISNKKHSAGNGCDLRIGQGTTERLKITESGQIQIPDNGKFVAGTGSDLQIYHDGTNSFIKDTAGASFNILATESIAIKTNNTEFAIACNKNGSVELYNDGSKKFETTQYGVNCTASLDVQGSTTLQNTFLSDNDKLNFGGGNDLQIYHDGSNSYLEDAGTGDLIAKVSGSNFRIRGAGNAEIAKFGDDGSVDLYYDNVKRLETQSSRVVIRGASGLGVYGETGANNDGLIQIVPTGSAVYSRLNLYNAAGNQYASVFAHAGQTLFLDTADNGHINFRANGTGDHIFQTNGVERLRIDGTDIKLPDGQKINFGTGNDLQIYHDGSNSYIKDDGTGAVILQTNKLQIQNTAAGEDLAKFTQNAAAELYYDNSKKFETTSTGVTVSGKTTFNDDLNGGDNVVLRLGNATGGDFEIYHNGTNSIINHTLGSGALRVQANDVRLMNNAGNEHFFVGFANDYAGLYFDNSQKLKTTSTGVLVTGTVTATSFSGETVVGDPSPQLGNSLDMNGQSINGGDSAGVANNRIKLGAGDDLQIYHDGSHSRIVNGTNGGTLRLQTAGSEEGIVIRQNGAVELYHDNSKKFETTSSGATVTGFLGINVASPDSPLEVAGTGPSLATIHHSDGGTNDEARIMLGALSTNPPDQRGAGISARNNGAGHNLEIQCSSSHSAGPSTKMTVRSDGNVGIGTSSLIGNSSSVYLTVNGSSLGGIALKSGDSTQGYLQGSGGTVTLSSDGSKNIRFDTNGSQRMNIASDGNVGVGKTSSSLDVDGSIFMTSGQNLQIVKSGSGGKILTLSRRTNVGMSIEFIRGSSVGSITHNNSSTSYNTTSDYRLKENVVTLSDAITRLKTLKPYRFNFISNKDTTVDGFLAHEVTAVPEAVTGIKDAVITQEMIDNDDYEQERLGEILPQGIDQAKLVPLLVAAVQELIGRVEKLEGA